uniref:Putative secreted protein n=1 Tax=Ixodes ricinus TaxID=34613 RepID=A0A6B0UDR9_IXORI
MVVLITLLPSLLLQFSQGVPRHSAALKTAGVTTAPERSGPHKDFLLKHTSKTFYVLNVFKVVSIILVNSRRTTVCATLRKIPRALVTNHKN